MRYPVGRSQNNSHATEVHVVGATFDRTFPLFI